MKNARILLLLSLGIWLGSCTSSKIYTDKDPQSNLTQYHTFKFTDGDTQLKTNPLYSSSLLENSIHAQIAIELEKRGIVENVEKPDMLVAYHTYTEKKRSAVNNYYPMMYGGWGWSFYPRGFFAFPYSFWNGYSRSYEYTEGTLIIDAIDAKTNQLVWRGSISNAIENPNNLHKKAIKAVELIFKKFPVQPGSNSKHLSKPLT
jgi:hypothetical protein